MSAGEAETWYLAICQACTPVLPQPFTAEAERDQWADAHWTGTGHVVLRETEVRQRDKSYSREVHSPGVPAEAMLPPGTRRATEAEIAALAEAARWNRNVITPDSAWVTENEFIVIQLPGRELWMTPAEWDAIAAQAAAAERERIRQVLVDYAEAVAADKGGSSDAFNAVADFADLLEAP